MFDAEDKPQRLVRQEGCSFQLVEDSARLAKSNNRVLNPPKSEEVMVIFSKLSAWFPSRRGLAELLHLHPGDRSKDVQEPF